MPYAGKLFLPWITLLALASVGVAHGAKAPVAVNGVANPFLANQPAGTACCGGDSAPDESAVLGRRKLIGGDTLTFSTTGGTNNAGGAPAPSADGFTDQPFNTTGDNGTGVSGPLNVYLSGLVGVFTTNRVPSGPAPAQLDSGVDFKKLSPGLNQIFWIGDGLTGTGTGTRQKFIVPNGATRLYLGTADGFGWLNNTGQILVTIHVKHAVGAALPADAP